MKEHDEKEDGDDPTSPLNIPTIIPEDVAQMAVHLTEYYQSQRLAYEKVSINTLFFT